MNTGWNNQGNNNNTGWNNNSTNNTGMNPNQGGFNPNQGGFNPGYNPTNPTFNNGMNTNVMNPGMNTNAMYPGMNTNPYNTNPYNTGPQYPGMNTNFTNPTNQWRNPYGVNVTNIPFNPNCKRCSGTGVVMRRGEPYPCRRCYKKAGYCRKCYGSYRNYFTGEVCICDNGRYTRRHSHGRHNRRHHGHWSSSDSDSDW